MPAEETRRGQGVAVATWSTLPDRTPQYALVEELDLVVTRFDDAVSVLYGRCLHRGALMADGHVDGENLICGVHGWDYRVDTGVSEYNNAEALQTVRRLGRFGRPMPSSSMPTVSRLGANAAPAALRARRAYLGLYADVHGTPELEPFNQHIQDAREDGLRKAWVIMARSSAMGVPLTELPRSGTTSRS